MNWFEKENPAISELIAQLCQKSLSEILRRQNDLASLEKKDVELIVSEVLNDTLLPKIVELLLEINNKQSERDDAKKRSEDANNLPKVSTTTLESNNPETIVKKESPKRNLENQKPYTQKAPSDTSAKWNYLPVPEGLDKHDESYCKEGKSTRGLKLIGARVRGKSHKHHGTNCDDWFEFSVSGNWTIIAVADGAGSKKFSRVGAKVSCEAAVKYLEQKLFDFSLKERDTVENLSADLHRDENWVFPGEDLEDVQQLLHQAMQTAYNAVEGATKKRAEQEKYHKILNRVLEVSDFSATLLLVIHTILEVGETNYDLVVTSGIGDGILASISCEGELKLLGKPDSGDYAGQTEFLTSKNQLEPENLRQKTCVFVGHLKALMVMSDGVADDYFPNDPNMSELYGDLVLNQVIEIAKPNKTDLTQNLRETGLKSIDNIKQVKHKFQSEVQRVVDPNKKHEPEVVRICSVAEYATELGKTVPEVVASSALLAGGILDEEMCSECQQMKPEQKLQLWLDSYYKKGSFDDRTLVILYQEQD